MFKITSTRAITWPAFALVAGENVFPSRKSVPAELWPKLARFRDLELLAFEGDAAAGDDAIVLVELSEQQLFQMSKADLAELAKANGVTLPDDAKKNVLLEALVAMLPKPEPTAPEPSPAPEAEKGKKAKASKPVSSSTDVQS